MDYISTIKINLLRAKSRYLKDLFLSLPGEKLGKILISPPDELVMKLKNLGRQEIDRA